VSPRVLLTYSLASVDKKDCGVCDETVPAPGRIVREHDW
jgi:hypothetical protein